MLGIVRRKHTTTAVGKAMNKRNHLRLVTMEGIPALAIFHLLGGPFQTSYLLHLGASSVQIGFALAIPSLTNIMQILGALFIQSISNRKMALLVLGGMHRLIWVATGLIPFLFPQELWVDIYLPVCIFAFICNSLGANVWTSIVADIVPASVRGSYFGYRNMILYGAGSLCLYIGGIILDKYPGATGFHILFIICGVMALWNIMCYAVYPNPPFEKSQETNPLRMFMKPFQDRKFLKSMLFISLWLFLQGIALPMFNYAMQKILNTGFQWISAVTIVQNVAMMLSYIFWGRLNSRYAARTCLFWTLPIIAAACLFWGLTWVLPSLLILFAIHVLVGVGTGGFNLLMFNFSIGDTPKSDRPMFVGVFSALTGLAGFLGPLLGGYLYEWTEGSPNWVQSGGMFVIIGGILLLTALTLGPIALRDKARKTAVADDTGRSE